MFKNPESYVEKEHSVAHLLCSDSILLFFLSDWNANVIVKRIFVFKSKHFNDS